MDASIGLETTYSIAARHGAMAAINAGFFRLDKSIFAGDAVGVLQINGRLFVATIDGRSAESVGMNLNELAAFLLEMGATDAMNLDGGGSTTMFLGGKVVNQPSDKEGERRVSDAILVFPRKKSIR